MLYAIISDIHGNIEALKAVHQDMQRRRVEKVVNLGDLVGYGPKPKECIDYSRQISDVTLQGNHDCAVVDDLYPGFHFYAEASGFWTRRMLARKWGGLRSTREYIDYLAGLPVSQNIDGVMLVAHDNLANPGNGFYMKPNETEEEIKIDAEGILIHSSLVNMQEEGVSVGFFAHTHTPRVYVANERDLYDPKLSYPEEIYEPSDGDLMMFNVGSVGQPRDNDPRACYVLVYCEDNQVKAVEYRRVEYNVEKTASQLRRSFIDRFIRRKGTETLKINYRFKMGEYETTIAKILIDRLRAGR